MFPQTREQRCWFHKIANVLAPGPTKIEYRQYLSAQPFTLCGYPIATVIAEKLSTAVALGDLNTRDRDYADLYQPITRHHLDGDELSDALAATAEHRGIRYVPSAAPSPTFRHGAKTLTRHGYDAKGSAAQDHPEQFADLVAAVTAFANPLLADTVRQRAWDPSTTTWS